MNFCQCPDGSKSVGSSEPTIPLILRGKRRQNINQSTEHQKNQIKRDPVEVKTNIRITIQPPPPIIIERPVISYVHPVIQQRRYQFSSPIKHQQSQIRVGQVQKYKNKFASPPAIEEDGIRRSLDQNLKIVYENMNEAKSSFQQHRRAHQSTELTRPKLEQKLVHEYINLIYRDYNIMDPLEKYRKQDKISYQFGRQKKQNSNFSEKQSISTEPNRTREEDRRRPGVMSKSTNKKAIQLKESFLIQMFSPDRKNNSHSFQRHQQAQSGKYSNEKSDRESIKFLQPFLKGNLEEISQSNEQQIKEVYRYCFVCQEPILQANLQIHEKQRCPQFGHLYEMSLDELKGALVRKIMRMRKETEQLYEDLFQDNDQKIKMKINELRKEAKRYLQEIDSNVKLEPNGTKLKNIKSDLKSNYLRVMNCYEDDYFKLNEKIRKLQWFAIMLKNLESKYYSEVQYLQTSSFTQGFKNTKQTQYINRRFSLVK